MCKNNTVLPKSTQIRNGFYTGACCVSSIVEGFPLTHSLTLGPGPLSDLRHVTLP